MKAAYIQQTGPAESLVYGELPKPQAKNSQVLVKVGAVAVNPVDTYIRSGSIQMPLSFPFIVGCDVAGKVEAIGPEVARFKPGDRVWGSNQGLLGRQGTFSEYACIEECWLYPTASAVTDESAAASALVGITAHLGLVREVKLKAGETLFVNGGTGGVGSMVVQMSKVIGAKVITTAGTDEKVKRCLELGADHAINYKTQDVAAEVRRIASNGVNVFWETLREPDFDKAVAMLAPRGRMIIMAGRDARPPFPVGPFYVKGCLLHGFVMFLATPDEQQACAADINRWLAEGKIKPNIARVMPLSETAAAHKLQEGGTIGRTGILAGKLVLKP
ncbi:MAG: NADPH:quinone reductase [Pirellulales bacterium]|nr:NADPH:quinone reductase [Pirellulales bacterium]